MSFKPSVQVKRTDPKIESVTIKMDQDTAHALMAVLARIAGPDSTSRRGLVQKILDGMEEAGMDYDTSDLSGELAFRGGWMAENSK